MLEATGYDKRIRGKLVCSKVICLSLRVLDGFLF